MNSNFSKPQITSKPWGREVLLHQGYGYAVKEITLLNNKSTSLHFHEIKHECIYVISGCVTLKVSPPGDLESFKIFDLGPGHFYAIPPKFIHQMSSNMGDSVYLESQTDHLEDVVRLSDPNNR